MIHKVKLWAVLNLIGVACGVAGGLLLAYALTLKPSNFRLVSKRVIFPSGVIVLGCPTMM